MNMININGPSAGFGFPNNQGPFVNISQNNPNFMQFRNNNQISPESLGGSDKRPYTA
jgi:hypothetical protein